MVRISIHEPESETPAEALRKRLLDRGCEMTACWGEATKVIVRELSRGVNALVLSTVGRVNDRQWGSAYVLLVRRSNGTVSTKISGTYFTDSTEFVEAAIRDLQELMSVVNP